MLFCELCCDTYMLFAKKRADHDSLSQLSVHLHATRSKHIARALRGF